MTSTGQMLLVLGALVLFSLLLPSINQTLLYNDRTVNLGTAELAAMGVAQSILAEARMKVFDVVCLSITPTLPSQLTPSGSLGPAFGETYPNFNDLDDFNNLSISDTTALASVSFNIAGQVAYINPSNPTQTSGSQTFVKRLRVTVTSSQLINPASNAPLQIQMEQLFAYYQ